MSRTAFRASLCVALLASVAGGRSAGQSPPAAAAIRAELDAVTVTGARREQIFRERVSAFVSSVREGTLGESLARWQVPICPYVTGASADQNEFIRRHIREVAREGGAFVADPECGANLVVILARDPETLLREWWSEEHRIFNTQSGVARVERFLQSNEGIRAWYNACDVSPDWVKSGPDRRGVPCGIGRLGSRLEWNSVRALYSVIVVVDLARIENIDVGQVADYVAMVGLTHIRRNAELGKLPTILRLFTETGSSRPRGLTSWDRTFIRALYATDATAFTQVKQVMSNMRQELGGTGPDQEAAVARLTAWTNRVTPGASRVASYTEVGAYYEGPDSLRSALVNYEAELEFVADGYFAGRRAAGERLSVYGDIQYIDEGDGWLLLGMAVHPR